MQAVRQYFINIYEAITSIFDGMGITFSYLWQKPVTIQYPNRLDQPIKETLSDCFRGFLQVDYNLCTSCDACAKACPIDCIVLDGIKVPDRKGKAPVYFYINIAKCMFCGLCVEPCPTNAIYFSREFESSYSSKKNLVFSYVPDEVASKYIEQGKALAADKKKPTEKAE